jgi:hypothetical protein
MTGKGNNICIYSHFFAYPCYIVCTVCFGADLSKLADLTNLGNQIWAEIRSLVMNVQRFQKTTTLVLQKLEEKLE